MTSTILKCEVLYYTDGKTDKFYKMSLAAVNGAQHTWSVDITFGRRGTSGTRNSKTFTNAYDAQSYYAKTLTEKIRKGYTNEESGKPHTYRAQGPAQNASKPAQRANDIIPTIRLQPIGTRKDVHAIQRDNGWVGIDLPIGIRSVLYCTPVELVCAGEDGRTHAVEPCEGTFAIEGILDPDNRLHAYDLLWLDNRDLRGYAYDVRLRLLRSTVATLDPRSVRLARILRDDAKARDAQSGRPTSTRIYARLSAQYFDGKHALVRADETATLVASATTTMEVQ